MATVMTAEREKERERDRWRGRGTASASWSVDRERKERRAAVNYQKSGEIMPHITYFDFTNQHPGAIEGIEKCNISSTTLLGVPSSVIFCLMVFGKFPQRVGRH